MIADLRAKDLWPSPLSDAALAEFRIRLSELALDERRTIYALDFRQAVTDLKTEMRPAWDSSQIETFVGVALALEEAGSLNPSYRRRLAWALLVERLFDRAADIYAYLEEDDHQRWREQALALAGAGRLDAAAEAIARSAARLDEAPLEDDIEVAIKSLNRRPGVLEAATNWQEARWRISKRLLGDRRDAAVGVLKSWFESQTRLIEEAIAVCREDEGGAASAGWAKGRERALAWLLLGRPDRAADPLIEAAGEDLGLDPAETEDALSLITIAAAAQPAEIQAELLAAAARIVEPGAARQALEVAMSVVAGADWRQAAWPDGDPGQLTLDLIATACSRSGRHEAAVAMFAALTRVDQDGEGIRRELAACQSLETVRRLEPRPGPRRVPRKVFDLFPYGGELELLKIKLNEMAPWVDRFVLVESATDLAGQPRPLHFEAQREALREFLPKIVHGVVQRFPNHAAAPAAREFRLRDEAIKGLAGLWGANDLVLLTDVGEVVDGRALAGFKGDAAQLKMQTFRHFLNHRLAVPAPEQLGDACVVRAALMEHYAPSLARTVLADALAEYRIPDAGWRFTDIGGSAEAEQLMAGGREAGWTVCGPELLPAYVRENWDRLKLLLL